MVFMILTIFGYPKSGKTLLFNLLTGQQEDVSKFSTSIHEFHKAVVNVPDQRLSQIASQQQLPPVYAKIEYLDTGAVSLGEGKNETFVDLLRKADGLVHMVRGFQDPEIPHPSGSIDPVRDINAMSDELQAIDFLSIEKRIEKLVSDVQKIKSNELKEELELMKKLKKFLEDGKPLREYNFESKEELMVRGFKFVSKKPLLHIINADENSYDEYYKLIKPPENNVAILIFCAKIETELLELDEEDRVVFQEEYGLHDYRYMRESFISESYRLMNLLSFFTIGKEEVRAWTLASGENAYDAAGKIHTDMQEGFIRAETINWQEFLENGGFTQAKDKGVLRLEGKEYMVKDGDILHIRFNK